MAFKKIKDHEHLVKDTINNSVINTDMKEYESYVERHRNAKQQMANAKRVENLEKDLKTVSSEISEIKELLKKLIV